MAAVAALAPVGLVLAAEVLDRDEKTATVGVAESAPMFADQFATAFTPGAVESLDANGMGAVRFTQPPKITEVADQ